MKQNLIKNVHSTFKTTCLLFLVFSTSFSFSQNQEGKIPANKYFDGFHIGLSFGSQNIFGGAFIDNLDVLGQKSALVVEFSSGYRMQLLGDRLLIGAELRFGITDGNLNQTDPRNQFYIEYENTNQFGYGLNTGVALGKNKKVLLYTYGSITKRSFDIAITDAVGSTFNQKDGQRFLRYGLGLEIPVYKKFNVNASVGRVNVSYDIDTNMDVDDKFDFGFGIIYQF